MADYISILDKAVSALGDNTQANRLVIYDKARAAIERKLRAMDPVPPEAAISRQMEQLEAGIQQVEAGYAAETPFEEVIAEAPVQEAPAAVQPVPVASESPAPVIVPEGFVDEPILIDGIGEKTAELLADEGVTKISQIAEMSDDQLAGVTAAIGYPGFETTQEWKQQSLDMLSGQLPRGKTNQDRLEKLQEEREASPAPSSIAEPVPDEPVTPEPLPVSEPDLPVASVTAPEEAAEPKIDNSPAPAAAVEEEPKASESVDEDYDAFLKAFSDQSSGKPAAETNTSVAPEPTPQPTPEPPSARPVTPSFEEPAVLGNAVSASTGTEPIAPPIPEPVAAAVSPSSASAPQARTAAPEFVSELENDFAPREQRAAPGRPHPALKQKKGAAGKVVTGSLLVLLLGGAAAGAYYFREPIMEVTQKGISATRALLNVDDTIEPVVDNTPAPAAETADDTPKDGSRLGNGETMPEPAPVEIETVKPKPEAPEQPTAVEPEPVRSIDAEPATVEVQEETSSETPAVEDTNTQTAENTTETASESATTTESAVLSGEKSYLYEEALGNTGASRDEGNITWSLADEAPEDGAPPEPVIKGMLEIPSRALTLNLKIKRNVDPALSASHLIELAFSPLSEFSGRNIDNISRFVMKANEQARGESLVGIPVRIDTGFFWIALNNLDQAQKTNLSLLENGDWVDVPVTYVTGRRALLTFEKGVTGKEVFAKALADWKNR